MPLLSLAGDFWGWGQLMLEFLLGIAAAIQAVLAITGGITVAVPGIRRKVWGPLGRAWRRHFAALEHMTQVDARVAEVREDMRATNEALGRMADTFADYAKRSEEQHQAHRDAIAAVNVRVDVVQAYMAGKEGGPLPWTP